MTIKRKSGQSYTTTPGAAARDRRRRLIGILLLVILVVGVVIFICRIQSRESARAATTLDPAHSVPARTLHYPDLDNVAGAPSSSVQKDYEGFRLSFNPSNKTPDWVAWELLRSEAEGNVGRNNQFHTDYDMPGCPDTRDYSNSGYDRGHMCPAADQKWSSQAMSDCFYMTNMVPQKHELNAGAWKTLEEKERIWAMRDSALVIVAGPVYTSKRSKRIGEARVRVPDAFFKCIFAPYVDKPRAIAFVYDNDRCPGNMSQYVTTVDEVEALTGFDFFASLPDELENEVERESNFKSWQ